ncbi:nuclear transport factor 2 family protein [Chloroflexi bacterium TSY]|nr:nuclear transport factor 2 family protein [Chloroflexi bacterium TSY]
MSTIKGAYNTSSTTNITAVRRFWQGFNARNLDVWDEVCTPDFINHDTGLPTPDADLPTLKQTIHQLLLTAFPDLQAAVRTWGNLWV